MHRQILRCILLIAAALLVARVVEAEEVQDAIPKHRAILKFLNSDPGAVRYFKLNDDGEVTLMQLCRRLSPKQIAAIKGIETLEGMSIGGALPSGCCTAPPAVAIAAEKKRHESFPDALPQFTRISTLKTLGIDYTPTEDDIVVVASCTDLHTLDTQLPEKLASRLTTLRNLKHLVVRDPKTETETPSDGVFLASFPVLERLRLPASYGDDTLEHLRNSSSLQGISASGISGQQLVDYFENIQGMSLADAMHASGFDVKKNIEGDVVELDLRGRVRRDEQSAWPLFDRLTQLRSLEIYRATDEQVAQIVRGKQLTSLSISGPRLTGKTMEEICKLKSLESLKVGFWPSEPSKKKNTDRLPIYQPEHRTQGLTPAKPSLPSQPRQSQPDANFQTSRIERSLIHRVTLRIKRSSPKFSAIRYTTDFDPEISTVSIRSKVRHQKGR